jgi:hypothetical protein
MMKFTPEERAKITKLAAYSGAALCIYLLILVLIFNVNEEQWSAHGFFYALLGLLGYSSAVYFGTAAVTRIEVKNLDGTKRRITAWELAAYVVLGGLGSQGFEYLESRYDIPHAMRYFVPGCLVVACAIWYFLQRRKRKALQ